MIIAALSLIVGGLFLGHNIARRPPAYTVAGSLCLLYGCYQVWCSATAFE